MIEDGIHFIGAPSALAQETRPPTSGAPASGENLSAVPGSEDFLTSPVAGEEQESASRSSSISRNWSGYFEWNGKGTFKQETAYFIEPSNKGDSCKNVGTAIWGGLGGNYEGAALGQDGTEQGNSGVEEEHLGWFEVLPEGPKPVTPRLHATPGSYFLAATEYKGSEEYSFYEYNYHTHQSARGIEHGKFDGNVADYIVERLGEYGLVNVGSVTMQGFTNNKAFGQGLTERVIMRNAAGETNAQPGAIYNKYEFHDKYEHCPGSSPKKGKTEEEGALPVATTEAASSVAETTTTLNGSVNPEGHETGYAFEYGTEAGNYSASTPEFEAGSGSSALKESSAITGLQPGTTYHYRIIANSTTGIAAGEDKTFTTSGTPPPPPPTATTEGASRITAHTATLEASVNPNGADTHYYFEYGTNNGLYEMDAPAIPGNDAGSGSTPVHVTVGVKELVPYTIYYYRVVASNSTGTSYGAEREFTTTATGTLSAGTKDTCALVSSGGVDCWGENYFGEVYPESSEKKIKTPVAVKGVTNAIEVAAGGSHVCALLSGGSIECWGDNQGGELGIGYTSKSSPPVRVTGITNAIAITAGDADTCALLSGGTIDCWGENVYGELGNGTTTNSSTPVPVKGITNAIAVTAGYASTCAVLSGGGMDCWGYNGYGELGNGTTTNSSTPVPVKGITNASPTAVPAVGELHACALLSGGSLDCWGYNEQGELGNGTTTNSSTPVAVSGITKAATVAAGYFHTCASLSAGGDDCWGENYFGELGNGTTTNSSTPVAVSGITTATGVAAGEAHSCARLIGGGVDCWGDNIDGQLGNGTETNSSTPVAVTGLP